MKGIILIISFSLLYFSYSITPTWKMEPSSKDVQTTNSFPIQSEVSFNVQTPSTSIKTSIKTYNNGTDNIIVVTSGSTTKELSVPFISVDSYVVIDDIFYICPSGLFHSYVYRYFLSTNTIDTLPHPLKISEGLTKDYLNKDWQLRCLYRYKNEDNSSQTPVKSFIVAFLGVDYVYWYCEYNNVNNNYGKWGNQMTTLTDYIIDIHFDEDYNTSTSKYNGYYYYYNKGNFAVKYGELNFNNGGSYEPHWNAISGGTIITAKDYGTTKILTQKQGDGIFDTYIMIDD